MNTKNTTANAVKAKAKKTTKPQAGNSQKSAPRVHAKKKQISNEKLLECCKKSNGIVSAVALMLGVDWHTADKYIKACPEAAQSMNCARESVIDIAESKLMQIVNNPMHPRHFDALTFLLGRLGKKRGYSEKVEQEVSGEFKTDSRFSLIIENN